MAEGPLVLVTRPEPEAHAFAALLAVKGLQSLIAPMLRIIPSEEAPQALAALDAEALQGVIVTSRHSVAALSSASSLHRLPLYAVGESTAALARQAGFESVAFAHDSRALLRLIRRAAWNQAGGAWLYARGHDISFDMKDALEKNGYKVEEVECYRAEAVERFPAALADALRQGGISIASFLSARTAQVFMRLAAAERLENELRAVSCACLSPAVAEAAGGGWKQTVTASSPTLHSLAESIDKLAKPL